ncbi:MAG: response regulator transcription factor [Clostridiaceae bacterium]|nr:response regulator transcription factor [Clostridiaceae bacterium]
MLRLIMVDDHKVFTDTLKFLIEKDAEIEVVGCAENVQEALQLSGILMPNIILMDIMMSGCDGIEGTGIIKEKYPSIKVIMLTTFGDDEKISRALKNGADGYVLKEIDSKELILAIKSVACGLGIVHRNVLSSIANKLKVEEAIEYKSERYNLNERDLMIISLIVDGKSNKEIAAALFFSQGSIRNSISSILEKLNLSDRTQLAVFALKNNLIF